MSSRGIRWVAVVWLVAGSVACKGDRAAPPAPAPSDGGATAVAPPEVWAAPVITEQGVTTLEISAASGGVARTPDGATLHLEAGALDRDTTVRITKHVPEPADEHVTVYDVDLGGASLTRAVALDLPIEHPGDVTAAEHVRITQLDPEAGWQELPGTLSADRRTITVYPTHFSPVRKEEPTSWAQYWFATDRRSPKVLDVPYYNQGDYKWCWATSLAMLEGALGRPTMPWEVAAAFGVDAETGSVGEAALSRYLVERGMTVEYDYFWSLWSLAGYIAHQIDQGRPVWIALPHIQHVIVVVGYSNDAVFVHDPSGIFFEYARRGGQSDPARLGRQATAWTWWDAIAAGRTARLAVHGRDTTLAHWNPMADIFPNHTLVITSSVAQARPLSLQVMPRRASLHIEHRRDLHVPRGKAGSVAFLWDGKAAEGWTFDHEVAGVSADADRERALCNSDVVQRVRLSVSNTGSRPTKVTLTAVLDGEVIGTKDATVPVGTGQNLTIPLTGPLVDARQPLALGEHTLELTLAGAGTESRSTLRFTMLPGMVPGVKVVRAGRKVDVSWAPSPEEAASPRLVYRIYRSRGSTSTMRTLVAEVARGTRAHQLELREDEVEARALYSVWAFDPETGLESMDAAYVAPTIDARVPPPAPELQVVDPVDVTHPDPCAGILGMPPPGC